MKMIQKKDAEFAVAARVTRTLKFLNIVPFQMLHQCLPLGEGTQDLGVPSAQLLSNVNRDESYLLFILFRGSYSNPPASIFVN